MEDSVPWGVNEAKAKPITCVTVYNVRTGVGSKFVLSFFHTGDVPGEGTAVLHVGQIQVQGYSISTNKDVSWVGPGFEPEVGGAIGVAIIGHREDGYPVFQTELITRIDLAKEVPFGPNSLLGPKVRNSNKNER